MTSEELSQELKDNLAKIDGILNIIRSSQKREPTS